MSPRKGWVGVDLDGTLAYYDEWRGVEHIGEPIPAMLERVKRWIAEGQEVRIFTARVDGGEVAIALGNENGAMYRDVGNVRHYIEEWCRLHIGMVLPITNVKDFGMIVLYDDRCRQVIENTGMIMGGEEHQ